MSGGRLPAGEGGIRRRVYLLMATGIAFPLALMAGAGLYWLRDLDDRILAGRLSAAGMAAAHFDQEITDDLETLQRLSAAVSSSPGAMQEPAELRRDAREAHQLFRHRETVFLLDRNLALLAVEPPGPGPLEHAGDLPVIEDVIRSGVPRLAALVEPDRGLVVHEIVPIQSAVENRVVGVAGGTFDPARRGFDHMLGFLRRGQTGFADVVDDQGRVIASTRPGRAGKLSDCRAHLANLVRGKRTEAARCQGCHAERGVTAPAPPDVVVFAPLAATHWGVVVRQEAREALPTEGAVPWYAVLPVLVLQLGLAGAFAWGAARSVVRPVQVLTVEAERIAGGALDSPIPELGEDEVGRLGRSLDRMRESLRGLIARVEHANAELEQRVAERTHELHQANEMLREREQARAQLLQKVISAQEDERKRIARELHDETSQSLAVLAMGLEAAQDAIRSGRTPRLDEVKSVAVRTLEDVHRLILDLRPSVLDDLGLLSAIRWYADRHLESRGISVRCEFGEMRRLAPEMETALFRICQEAMSNVARHAQATAVLVQVGIEGEEIRIDIEDDGKGFDPAEAARREGRRPWGLMGIRERAQILGGDARIESAPGRGTLVDVRIPLAAALGPAAGQDGPGGGKAGGEGGEA
ncbi:MAG TPA: HAMP domain-containing protein [Anaeromyxobacter sp.]|nr:HAMP domain-containing protein [Anaeromyxobacter sp.]